MALNLVAADKNINCYVLYSYTMLLTRSTASILAVLGKCCEYRLESQIFHTPQRNVEIYARKLFNKAVFPFGMFLVFVF